MGATDLIYDALAAFSKPPSWPAYHEGVNEAESLGYGHSRADVYGRAFADVLCGRGEFWPTHKDRPPAWDCDQHLDVMMAVQQACAAPATDAERWQIVNRALANLAHRYADDKAGAA